MARRTLYLTLMATVAVLAVACSGAPSAGSDENAQAAFPAKIGRIAFQGSNGAIYTINPIDPGKGKTEVTKGEQPSYSPDGTKIAFAASDGHDAEIYTVESTGGKPIQVTNNVSNDLQPSFAPDGRRIAYTCSDGHDAEICTLNPATGGKPFQLTKNEKLDFGPSWSPSGNKIAYSGLTRTDWEIFTIDARGGARFNVTDNDAYDYYPDYSPNGKKIAYAAKDTKAQDAEIRTIKATGGRPFTLTNNAMDDLAPSYSPDGKRIAYMHYSDPDRPERAAAIYKIAAGGGKGLLVTANGGTGALFPSWGSVP
jgi:Tol biopolymer transport system component